jgi:tetratricopeptide (TPR) repeat protein
MPATMIFASTTLKNGRNDYVFNIAATPALLPRGKRPDRPPAPDRALDPLSAMPRNWPVESSSALRPAKPAWAGPGAAGSAAVLAAATLLAYSPALTGRFLWDDDAHVTKPALRTLNGLWRIWFEAGATQQYYPLLHTAFWAEHRLWGDSVLGYHLINVALHTVSAWLLVLILRRFSFSAPLLAGLIFALHPVCVESVAWISEQKNTLSGALYLSSALLYLRFDETRRRGPYAWALVLFVLALLTKSVTATLPAALLVVFWWRRGTLGWRRDVLPLVPWFAVGAASGTFTAWMEERFIGAEGADFSLTALQRVFLAARDVVFYLREILWSVSPMFVYPRWSVPSETARNWLCLAAVMVLAGLLFALARRQRGPLAAFLYFVATLSPALGFVNVYPFLFSYVADHFAYLASIGIIVPSAWVLSRAAGRLPAGGALLVLAVPAGLGFLTWRESRTYRDPVTLYRTTIQRNPEAWLMHFNLAVSLGMGPEHLAEAVSEYRATVRLKPDHWRAHNNLASALLKTPGNSAAAVAEFEEALRYNPDYAEAHNNLGVALEVVPGRLGDAEAQLRAAIRINPGYDAAHANLGILLLGKPGSSGEALGEFDAAIRLAPGVAEYHYDKANALARDPGRTPDAVEEYRAALRLRPDYPEALSNLGVALAHLPGRSGDAIAEFEAALRLDPGNAHIHANLGDTLAKIPGRRAEAIAEFEAAVKVDPSDARIHFGMGQVLASDPGRLRDAAAEFETAVRLRPDFAEAHCLLGICLELLGRHTEAVSHLETALALRPDFEFARGALRRIETTSGTGK